jgi:predicted RNase H-like nuclease
MAISRRPILPKTTSEEMSGDFTRSVAPLGGPVTVAGADAARIGKRKVWAVVELRDGRFERVSVRKDLRQVAGTVDLLAVDLPIWLPGQEGVPLADGKRRADREARELVHSTLRSTVFWSPPRGALEEDDYGAAREIAPSLSAQAFALTEKIREVQELAAEGLPVLEFHPEVTFAVLEGGPPTVRKRAWDGQLQRRRLLERAGLTFPGVPLSEVDPEGDRDSGLLPPDDVLDAAAGALTADRVLRGQGRALGVEGTPGIDQRGVIWCPAG